MRVLVTAGPTREMIDDVRFLSNLSSGKTGFAIAQAARDLGHEVVLVAGPVSLPSPAGIKVVNVVSAHDMHQAVLAEFSSVDVVIMSAAVADYTPRLAQDGKMKKKPGPLNLELIRTTDILKDLGQKKEHQVLIGFALEVQNAEDNARRKLEQKNADLIVLNGPANFGSDQSTFRLVDHNQIAAPQSLDKSGLGRLLIEEAEKLRARR